MALTFVMDIENFSADLSTAVLTDLTVYGGSNPARSALALYIYFYKRSADLTDTQITIDNTSPTTANQWSFTLPQNDGVFVGSAYGFTIWSAGTYALNACVYYATDGKYYIANTSTSQTPGGSEWTLITDILATVTGNSSVQQGQFYCWSSARSSSGALGDAMADLGNRIKEGKCKNWEGSGTVLNGAAAIESAFVNFRRTNYVSAQQIIDWVQAQTSLTL